VTNSLRMSFGEWLYRMFEAEVPPAARNLAIYAAVFDVTGNDELARLAGLEDSKKNAASRTYDKWKKQLLTDGWVLVGRRDGGRGIGIEVHPAVRQTPVEFTDVLRRNPRKIYPRKDCQTPAENTPVTSQTPANSAGVPKKVSPTPPSKKITKIPSQSDRLVNTSPRDADGQSEIAGLNGATSLIVSSFAKWMNPHVPDVDGARKSIGEAVRIYGDRAVRDGFAELSADIADGKLRVPTVKSFYGYCRTAKEREGRYTPRQAGVSPKSPSDEMRSIEAIVGKDKFAEIMRGRS
jgi:hypothetical protein